MRDEESYPVESHIPCGACGSSDALTIYSDGHSFCYSCEKLTPADDSRVTTNAGFSYTGEHLQKVQCACG